MALGTPNFEKKYIILHKSHHYTRAINLSCNSLNTFRHIIHYHQDVIIIEGKRKWAHKINSPQIKKFSLQDIGQRHLILSCISIHSQPIKTKLPYLCNYLGSIEIITTLQEMTMIKIILNLILGHNLLIIPSAQCLYNSGSFQKYCFSSHKIFSSNIAHIWDNNTTYQLVP